MKKLCSLLLDLALALSLAACGGSGNAGGAPVTVPTQSDPAPADPVPAALTGPVGTWVLSEAAADLAPGAFTLVLDKNGSGYAAITDTKRDFVYNEYLDLSWSDNAIILDGTAGVFLVNGDTLLFTLDEVTMSFLRSGDVPAVAAPKPGVYRAVRFFEEGEEYSSEDPIVLSLSGDGTGSWTQRGEDIPMTWNQYFFKLDGEHFFYLYEDGSLSIYDGEYLVICAAD